MLQRQACSGHVCAPFLRFPPPKEFRIATQHDEKNSCKRFFLVGKAVVNDTGVHMPRLPPSDPMSWTRRCYGVFRSDSSSLYPVPSPSPTSNPPFPPSPMFILDLTTDLGRSFLMGLNHLLIYLLFRTFCPNCIVSSSVPAGNDAGRSVSIFFSGRSLGGLLTNGEMRNKKQSQGSNTTYFSSFFTFSKIF